MESAKPIGNQKSSINNYNPPMLGTVLAGTAVTAAVTAEGYKSMAPTGQWYGRTFTGLPSGTKLIALRG